MTGFQRPTDDDCSVFRLHELLVAEGYKPTDEAWEEFGRRTYVHDDDASRDYIKGLARLLARAGWGSHPQKLRAFRHPVSQQEIELEPGGSGVPGHFLHYMRMR